jgi:hypothetical protein
MKVEGAIADDTLSINVIDLILKDVGTAGYTEYDWGTTLADYFEGNEDKWPVMFFSIHSHHTMGVSPSGVDDKHLYDNIENFPFHLSVIVNNKLDFNARIATDMFVTKVNMRAMDSSYTEKEIHNSRIILEYSLPVSLGASSSEFEAEFEAVVKAKAPKAPVYNPMYRDYPIDFSKRTEGLKVPTISTVKISAFSLATIGYKYSNIDEVMKKMKSGFAVDLYLDDLEKYCTELSEQGFDKEICDNLLKCSESIENTHLKHQYLAEMQYGIESIGLMLEGINPEEDDTDLFNRPVNSLTEDEFNRLARLGMI